MYGLALYIALGLGTPASGTPASATPTSVIQQTHPGPQWAANIRIEKVSIQKTNDNRTQLRVIYIEKKQ